MKSTFLNIAPVLPSQDIDRDVQWYLKNVGFKLVQKDKMYAVLKREDIIIHLQWHSNTIDVT